MKGRADVRRSRFARATLAGTIALIAGHSAISTPATAQTRSSPTGRGDRPERWVAVYDALQGHEDSELTYYEKAAAVEIHPRLPIAYTTGHSYQGALGRINIVTIAYDTANGEEIWRRRYDGIEGQDELGRDLAVSPDGRTAYVVGAESLCFGCEPRVIDEMVLIAYNARNGRTRWTVVKRPEGDAAASGESVAVSPDSTQVFVAGEYCSTQGSTSCDVMVSSYAATTGGLLWETFLDGPAHDSDYPFDLVVDPNGQRIYVAGDVGDGAGYADALAAAFDAATGEVLWTDAYDNAGLYDTARSIAISPDGSRLYMAGHSSEGGVLGLDIMTRAIDATTGNALWTSFHGSDGLTDAGADVAVSPNGNYVVVAGSVETDEFDYTPTIIALEASSGGDIWAVSEPYYGEGRGVAVAPSGDRVYLAAWEDLDGGFEGWVSTHAYDIQTGTSLWVGHFNSALDGSDDDEPASGRSISVSPNGKLVVVTGWFGHPDQPMNLSDYGTVAYQG